MLTPKASRKDGEKQAKQGPHTGDRKMGGQMVRLLIAVIAIGLAALSAEARVSAVIRPGTGPTMRPGAPGVGGSIGLGTDQVTVYVGRQYQGFTRLDLDPILDFQVRGRVIETLSIRMQGPGGRSQAALMEDGRVSAPGQRLADYLTDHYFQVQYPRPDARLALNLNGPVYIESVTATVRDTWGNPPPQSPTILVSGWVQQSFRGGALLNVGSYVDLSGYQGMRVVRVTVRASSARGYGQADLVVNGRSQGTPQSIGTWTDDVGLEMLSLDRLGYEIHDLGISLRGEIAVESITVELEP